MPFVRRIVDWLNLSSANPELAVAQYGELQRQIPLLYSLLTVNAVAVAFTHRDVAPVWMTVWSPAVLVAISLFRLYRWIRRPEQLVSGKEAIRLLRRTVVLGSFVSLGYITWSLGLSHYGADHQQAHVAIFIAITVIGCIFCLMHLPQAAFAVTGIVTLPYLVHYLSAGDPVYAAIGLNILLVTLVMIRVLLNSYRGFEKLIRTQGETERLNREVTILALTDMLTGLPNRRLFFAELEAGIERCKRADSVLALGVIDLDRFKAVNDTFGHAAGDQLLEAVGARLRDVFGPDRLIARLGGDEFAFALEAEAGAAVALATEACEALSEPFRLGELAISIGASCGIATTHDVPGTARTLYDGADYALYKGKSDRRGFATLYSAEHEMKIRSERAIEAALQAADLEAEMEIYLQPIVGIDSGVVRCVEALARWTSPRLGRVPPDEFIQLAERAGIVHRLTLILFGKALACVERLPPGTKLSFNLSAHDLVCTETVLAIVALVRRSGVDPSRLMFELTETAVMRDFEAADASMRILRALGASIALDDFGTGQSSLVYLRRLPIDKLKIDRSFVTGASDASGRELLSAVVSLCKSLHMPCIAEGVEESSQLDYLRGIGCDAFQGYLAAKPMPIEELLRWSDERSGPGVLKAATAPCD